MTMNNRHLLRAASAFIAGSLVGCAPAGLINQIRVAGQANPSIDLSRPYANAGEVTFTLRWPGVYTRQAQAIPGSATAVVAIIWKDGTRQRAAAVHTFKRDGTDTRFNGQTGRYESYARMLVAPGDGYVMELKAYDVDPQYREVSVPTAAADLVCGAAGGTGTGAATSSTATDSAQATSSTGATASTDATSSTDASGSTTATASTTATESATNSAQVSPCTVTAKVLASGESSPFKVQPGHATPLRILLSAVDGPVITGLSNKIVPSGGTTLEVLGKNFGTDSGKVRAALVPAYNGWGNPIELTATDVSATALKVQIPQNAFSGAVYVFVDGIEATATGSANAYQVVRRIYVTSDNLKFDLKSQGCTTCNETDKVYAVANATVSLKVFGEEATPWGYGGNYNPGDPNSVPQGAVALPPGILKVEPTLETTATTSVDAQGRVIFPTNGTWNIRNTVGLEQNWNQTVYAGLYTAGTGMVFARDEWNPGNIVTALVPGLTEQWFGGQGISNQVQPQPNAKLNTPGGNLTLSYKDFTWAVSPAEALNVTQDGRYTMTTATRQDVTFSGTLKLDPSKKVSKALPTGISVAITPSEAYVSQNLTGSTPALTKQQFHMLLTAGNGATVSTEPPCSPGCQANIPASQYSWSSGNQNLLAIDSGGLASTLQGKAETGDVPVSVSLAIDPEATATASVHVTNNGGLALDIQ